MPREEKSKTIAIVTYPGVALLDLVVTQTVLDRGTRYRTVWVEPGGPTDRGQTEAADQARPVNHRCLLTVRRA